VAIRNLMFRAHSARTRQKSGQERVEKIFVQSQLFSGAQCLGTCCSRGVSERIHMQAQSNFFSSGRYFAMQPKQCGELVLHKDNRDKTNSASVLAETRYCRLVINCQLQSLVSLFISKTKTGNSQSSSKIFDPQASPPKERISPVSSLDIQL
jgi:hypothetical protein